MVRTHRYNNDLLWLLSSRATHEMATGLTFKSISMKGCMFMSLPPKCTSMISRAAWLSLFSLLIFNRDMRSSGKKTIGNKSTFFKRVVRMVRVKCSIASNSHVISPGSHNNSLILLLFACEFAKKNHVVIIHQVFFIIKIQIYTLQCQIWALQNS